MSPRSRFTPGRGIDRPAFRPGLAVKRHLLARREHRPCHLQLALLAEHEPQLPRGAKALRMIRAVGGTRAAARYCAQQILVEKAVLAAHPRARRRPVCHASLDISRLTTHLTTGASNRLRDPRATTKSGKRRNFTIPTEMPANSDNLRRERGSAPAFSVAFRGGGQTDAGPLNPSAPRSPRRTVTSTVAVANQP